VKRLTGLLAAVVLIILDAPVLRGQQALRDAPKNFHLFTDADLDSSELTSATNASYWGLDENQKRRILEFTYFNENEQPYCRYEYIENLHDGRGYTAGCIGFTLQWSILRVLKEYQRRSPNNELVKYIPRAEELKETTMDEVTGMPGFVEAWQKAADDPDFRASQDAIVDREVFNPAMEVAHALRITTAFGKCIIFDTTVQHGLGDADPDGLEAIIRKTEIRMGGDSTPETEIKWLTTFLEERRKILAYATDPVTRDVWAPSVGRVDWLKKILDSRNLDLRDRIPIPPEYRGPGNQAWFD
jgi:chitosanase